MNIYKTPTPEEINEAAINAGLRYGVGRYAIVEITFKRAISWLQNYQTQQQEFSEDEYKLMHLLAKKHAENNNIPITGAYYEAFIAGYRSKEMAAQQQGAVRSNRDKLSIAKDLAAQRHEYADWQQIDCLELQEYEKDAIKVTILDDIAELYASQSHPALTEAEINEAALAAYPVDANYSEDKHIISDFNKDERVSFIKGIQWLQNYQTQGREKPDVIYLDINDFAISEADLERAFTFGYLTNPENNPLDNKEMMRRYEIFKTQYLLPMLDRKGIYE